MTREELTDKMLLLPKPHSRANLIQQVWEIMNEDCLKQVEELKQKNEELLDMATNSVTVHSFIMVKEAKGILSDLIKEIDKHYCFVADGSDKRDFYEVLERARKFIEGKKWN